MKFTIYLNLVPSITMWQQIRRKTSINLGHNPEIIIDCPCPILSSSHRHMNGGNEIHIN